jgi:hypothetical protein
MHTALIFKELAKVKEPGLREKGLAQPLNQYNILKDMIFFVTKETNKIYIHQSLRQRVKEYCPGTMNIYFIRDREQ